MKLHPKPPPKNQKTLKKIRFQYFEGRKNSHRIPTPNKNT